MDILNFHSAFYKKHVLQKKLIKNKRNITGDVKELSTLVEHTFNQSAVLFL